LARNTKAMKEKNGLKLVDLGEGKYEVDIKPSTTTDLAAFYGIKRDTMREQIKHMSGEIGRRVGNYFSARQVRMIINELGLPGKLVFETDVIREG
jgi:hypothetical protein